VWVGVLGALGLFGLALAFFFVAPRAEREPTPQVEPTSTPTPYLTPTPLPPKVGIVAGHYQYDVGALCPDGTREVDINYQVALKVVALLLNQGYRAEVLGEFDPKLEGYKADAVVALHSDSCIPGSTGFKIARAWDSFIPDIEDELVACLYEGYEAATGLKPHLGSITRDMLGYHVFGMVAPETPAAIIEMGFMADDADFLRNHQDTAAQGIFEGIRCFLEKGTESE
jgi:N-acetylmuramoyl-L-alanine amidase